jgi:hypothetical protein
MNTNPKRRRVLVLFCAGAISIAAWAFLLYRYGWTLKWVGMGAIAVTVAMMGVLLYSYITRRGIAHVAFALSIAALLLCIIAMGLVLF